MPRTVPNHRGLAASLLALSLVATLSLSGCGSDAVTAPENRGGDISNIEDPVNGNEGPNIQKHDENKMEDGR